MNKPKSAIVAGMSLLALAATLSAGLNAQQTGFTRTLLQKGDLSAPGREAVQVRAEFAPGVAAGRHTHPGEEFTYIMEGTLVLEVDGKPPQTLKAGDAFFVEAGRVHDGRNIGAGTAKVLATYIVEKGKPLASPAP